MKISVCMASYNGQQYIGQQLASILPQLGTNDELIISDDHSSDATPDIIAAFADARIQLIKNPSARRGPVSNFENALKNSSGELILLCDQDDVWMPGKVARMKQALLNCDLVLSDCFVTDQQLNITADSFFSINGSQPGFFKNFVKNSYMGCCMGFRRCVLNRALPFPPDIPMHDSWIGLLGELYFRVAFIPEPLLYYRRHQATTSPTGQQNRFSLWKKLMFRYCLFKNLVKNSL